MHSSVFKFFVGLILGIAVIALIAFNSLLLWVASGPRSLDRLTPYIESALKSGDGSYSVKIGETWLLWDGWRHPVNISLRRVSVLTKDGQTFSNFPEIELGVDVLSLPLGRLLPTSLSIVHPAMSLYQNEDRSLSFGFREQEPAETEGAETAAEVGPSMPLATLAGLLLSSDDSSNFRKLRFVTISDAAVAVHRQHKGVVVRAHDVDIQLKRRHGTLELSTRAKIRYDEYESKIESQFSLDREQPDMEGQIDFTGVMPSKLAALFSDNPAFAAVRIPMSGSLDVAIDRDGIVQRARFQVAGGSGTIHSDRLDGDLDITALSATGQVGNRFNDIQIDSLVAGIGQMGLSGSGAVSINDKDAAIRGDLTLKNVTAEDVHLLWPPGLSPVSREWVTANIRKGSVPQARAHVDIKFGDLQKPVLPKEAVDAEINLEGATIRYLPEHPEVSDVDGVVRIDGVSLNADIAAADYMKDTKIEAGKLEIADLNADNPHIVVELKAATSARDAVNFLKLPRLGHAQRLNLDSGKAEGSAEVTAKVGFDFFAPRDAKGKTVGEQPIDYDVKAVLKDVSQPGFMNKFDIRNANGELAVNNAELTFKGQAEVNGASVSDSKIRYVFKPEGGFDTFIDVKAAAPVEALTRFGYPALPFLKGRIVATASMKQGPDREVSGAKVDLANAAIYFKDLGLEKPEKEPATLDISAEKKNGAVNITNFHLTGKNTDVSGKASLNKELSDIQSVSVDKALFGQTNLSRAYFEFIPGGYRIEAQGASADMTSYMAHDPKVPRNFSFEHFPAMQLKADVARVILGPGRELSGVKGELTCDVQTCSGANIGGQAGGKPFALRIMRNPKGTRQLSLHAENAGAFLKALDVIEGMEEGDLTIIGNYDEGAKGSILKGRMDITEHTIKKAPVLAKILSLASLTGFIDVLQGNGIRFHRLSAPFTLSNDVITFDKAKTFGPSVGMTMEGTVTMPAVALNLQGTVVPAYSVNTVLGKLPLLGNLLTGGEGQGVFAASYSVRGTEQNPDVSVNPLSMLTPGFLRGLFEAGEASEVEKEK